MSFRQLLKSKILKENIEEILIPLAEKLLQISLANAKELPDAIQITLEREPDLLKIIDDKKSFKLSSKLPMKQE